LAEISLRELGYRYAGAPAATLTGLNLEIASGEAHALLGGSGTGKSTLLNLLSGLLPAQTGVLRIGGADMRGVNPAERRVSQVFQFPVLYDAMTVRDNLTFPLKTARMPKESRRVRVLDIARRLDVEHLLERKPSALSVFEKQLVAIGKSLVRPDVSLVLLDEPLTAAEPARKWQLRRTLKALQRESGATMIYVTHDQTEALTFADRISVLHDGRILQTGTPQELLDKPSHEHVGYFVGTPGMNFLDAVVEGGYCVVDTVALMATSASPGGCRVGFRPEWAQLTPGPGDSGLRAHVSNVRILGTHRNQPVGLVEAQVNGVPVSTRQLVSGIREGPARLDIERGLVFRDGRRVDAQ
jgi:glycerol transport system ATP-binding protein